MGKNKLSFSETGISTFEKSESDLIFNDAGISIVEEGVSRNLVSATEGGGYGITLGTLYAPKVLVSDSLLEQCRVATMEEVASYHSIRASGFVK